MPHWRGGHSSHCGEKCCSAWSNMCVVLAMTRSVRTDSFETILLATPPLALFPLNNGPLKSRNMVKGFSGFLSSVTPFIHLRG